MSYPPPPPSGPEDPNASQDAGQSAPPPPPPPPSYGQQPPAPPAYGEQPPPQYGQQPPAYGQPNPYGQPPYPPPPYGQSGYPNPYAVVEGNKKALWGMISGIVGVLFCGIVLGIVAIVLGIQAKNEIEASGGRQTGAGQATASLILGIVDILISIGLIALIATSN